MAELTPTTHSSAKDRLAPGGRPGFMPAAPHPQEQERISSLHSLQVLDSDHEKRYDDLTRLVADIFEVPICLISLIDENRQWFKSHCGLDARETSRDLAFCAHALHEEHMLVINDASKDERFHDNALVTGPPHVCFYAGAVLRDSNGLPLGTLCIIDHVPRQLSPRQRTRLKRCAILVENELVQRDALLAERSRATLQASIDPVTGYSTRRRYLQQTSHWLKAQPTDSNVQIILIKLQEGERWRRQQGIDFVDAALQSVSSQLNENFDDTTLLKGRLRHDTLVVMLPGQQAMAGMRWMRFVNQSWLLHLASGLRPTLMISTATLGPDSTTPFELTEILEEELQSATDWAPLQNDRQVADLTSGLTLRIDLNMRFSQALRDNELDVHVQPILRCDSLEISGLEMLLRWKTNDRWVTPHQLLRIAAHTGLTEELDLWVLRQGCALLNRWQVKNGSPEGIPLSINVSARRLLEVDHVETMLRVLRLYRVKGEQLRLDISGVEHHIGSPEPLVAAMKTLAKEGITFCIDRFGPENDSLRLLSLLPAQSVKLHPRWIALLQTDPRQGRLLKAWTAALSVLDLEAIAVGVESECQKRALAGLGFDQLQGFALGHPMPSAGSYREWRSSSSGTP